MQDTYIDIHTHKMPDANTIALQNLSGDFERVNIKGRYSAGLHPWFIKEENFENDFLKLKDATSSQNVEAIGECGLDKVFDISFELQVKAFERQIALANEIGKPLIIHCVRAFGEVINMLSENKNKVPVIFHGFNRNATLAKQLIDKGFYLSFGEAILNKAMKDVFDTVPLESIFLETDKSSLTIQRLYAEASEIKNMDIDFLNLQMLLNAFKVFGEQFLRL